MKNVALIMCAAGASSRFGGDRKKPFIEVKGQAAFLRSFGFFNKREDIKQKILVISPDDRELVEIKWGANLAFDQIKLCEGGAERFETVAKALKLVKDDIDLIAVHDAVRCCLKDEWIDEVIKAAGETGAAMLASPVVSTLKKVERGKVTGTVDREGVFEAQTPQVFDAKLLKKAYGNLSNVDTSKITDDCGLVEALGEKVSIVQTDSTNIKITVKNDVVIAEAIIRSRPKPKPDGPIGPYVEAQW
ncbi:MAG: 2-C-methyl-D-erythritol 4-phosphate cytidylyltransferase [Sedimentisphaerales bacterium]|nr:2-C-methyl-D-erythritol 4-phosphate cytidylyltransferase [Sedimentisphaerales bacterium]